MEFSIGKDLILGPHRGTDGSATWAIRRSTLYELDVIHKGKKILCGIHAKPI